MPIGRFYAGIAAVIWTPGARRYLLLRRSADKDFGAGVWECVTGRVNRGEGFEEAVHREVREEIGLEVQIDFVLGTTHFYRGPEPTDELVGVIFFCTTAHPAEITLSTEHSAYRWVTAEEAQRLLSASDPSTRWMRRVLRRAEALRERVPASLVAFHRKHGFELG
ncbi:MAG: NUDIX domain-containing protein [Anaerolineae bacterium]